MVDKGSNRMAAHSPREGRGPHKPLNRKDMEEVPGPEKVSQLGVPHFRKLMDSEVHLGAHSTSLMRPPLIYSMS